MRKDRRSGNERRGNERFAVSISVEWEGSKGRKQGSISDISLEGCFVLCSGEVEDGENVKIFLPLGGGMRVQFWGEVTNHIYEIGFAARFIQLSETQMDLLEKLLERLQKKWKAENEK